MNKYKAELSSVFIYFCIPIVLKLSGFPNFDLLSLKSWIVYWGLIIVINIFIKFIKKSKQKNNNK